MITKKIMLLGDMGVGKTSLVNRLCHDTFSSAYKASIGVDFRAYPVEPSPAGEPFTFHIWDTDGSYAEAIFRTVYIKGAHAAVIVGDATLSASLESMARLAQTFEQELPGRYFCCVVNKVDLLQGAAPQLPADVARLGLPVVETSAKTGHNVTALFHDAAATIVRRGL